MYAEDGKLHVEKGFFTFASFLQAYKPHKGKKCVLHFRIKTHGDVNVENSHPFNISDNLAFVHNGIITGVVEKDKTKSDTWHFNESILKPMYRDNQGFIKRAYNQTLISDFIGSSKLIFMNNKGHATIINSDKGKWDDGVWYSNDSYKPRKAVVVPNKHWDVGQYNSPFLEGDYVEFVYDYGGFKKGAVVYVDTVLPNKHLRVIDHIYGQGRTIEISRVVPPYTVREYYRDYAI